MGKTKERHNSGTQGGLSWIYRRKKKLQRTKNTAQDRETNVKIQNSPTKIVVRNLSFKVTEEDVRKFYEKYGEIQEIILPRQPNGTLFGYGFIEFKRMQDASKAIFNTNKKEFFGRKIISAWAIENSRFCEKVRAISESNDKNTLSTYKQNKLDIPKQRKSLNVKEIDTKHKKRK